MPFETNPNLPPKRPIWEHGQLTGASPLYVATCGLAHKGASAVVEYGEIARLLLTLDSISLEGSRSRGVTPIAAATAWSKSAAEDLALDLERAKGVAGKLVCETLRLLVDELIDFKLDPEGWRKQRFHRAWPEWKHVVALLSTCTPFDADCLDVVLDYLRHPSFMHVPPT